MTEVACKLAEGSSIEGELENMKKGEPKEGGGRGIQQRIEGISQGQKEGYLDRVRGGRKHGFLRE